MPPEHGPDARPGPDARRRRLELLVALTRESIDAAVAGNAGALGALDARRRRAIEALGDDAPPDGASGPACAALADEALELDARLLAEAGRVRDELGAQVRALHGVARAQAGYAATGSLAADARRA